MRHLHFSWYSIICSRFLSFYAQCFMIRIFFCKKGERERERIVACYWIRKISCAIGAHFPRGIPPWLSPKRRCVIAGNYEEERRQPRWQEVLTGRDSLANARSDYRGELIATDREMHWRQCGAQPSVVAFLLRWSRRRKSMSGDGSTCTHADVSIVEHPIILHKNLFCGTKKLISVFSHFDSFFCLEFRKMCNIYT